jgi:prepilin-type N-terminal cleavage/methylation domain-containing protein
MIRRGSTKGFTLVELMVVIAIIAAIIALVLPTLMRGKDQANATLCQAHLSEIGKSLLLFKTQRDHYPKESGIRFFLAPWNRKVLEKDPKNAKIYVCPGDENLLQRIEGDYGIVAQELEDWEYFSSDYTSYAGRDQKRFPIDFNNPTSQLIVCDDDEDLPNHPSQINVLFMSGAVDRVLLDELEEGEEFILGEDSPLELFRVMTNE